MSTTFNPPYVVARQLQSLHWLSNGRTGWNIVTSIEGAENFGDSPMPSPQERYAKAREFTEVVRKLWMSFPHESLRVDRESGVFVDMKQVKAIDHSGEFFLVLKVRLLCQAPSREYSVISSRGIRYRTKFRFFAG